MKASSALLRAELDATSLWLRANDWRRRDADEEAVTEAMRQRARARLGDLRRRLDAVLAAERLAAMSRNSGVLQPVAEIAA